MQSFFEKGWDLQKEDLGSLVMKSDYTGVHSRK